MVTVYKGWNKREYNSHKTGIKPHLTRLNQYDNIEIEDGILMRGFINLLMTIRKRATGGLLFSLLFFRCFNQIYFLCLIS
jgi:hypothetical protein